MSNLVNKTATSIEYDKLDKWFDDLISTIEMDKFLLKEDIADAETKRFYSALMSDNIDELARQSRTGSQKYFIEKIILDYLSEIRKSGISYKKLALDLGNSKVLSWVELTNDDEEMENKVIMAEARLNAKYQVDGFHISTTIVEERDNTPVPSHYSLIA